MRFAAPLIGALLLTTPAAYPAPFTLEQVLSAPFASDIVAAPAGRTVAWASNASGRRNLWLAVARAPNGGFAAHPLAHYAADDGLEISDIAFVPGHDEVVYVLGGDIEYPDKPAPDPAQLASGVGQQVYMVDFRGHPPVKLGDGHAPLASPDGARILFLHEGKAFAVAPRKGAKAEQLFKTRGVIDSLRFSPDDTQGTGIETQPALLEDGTIAFLRSDARRPAHAALLARGSAVVDLTAEGLPQDFPAAALVEPHSVELPQRAGIAAHGVLFLPAGGRTSETHPAVIFMHGGPIRQMLPGWHYMDYYSNAYAFNQYLASRGYVVLALNYRAGIGYGLDFREADGIGAAGASEYNDLLAAADFLRARTDVDPARIGLWGGSYGGYMTALGLARNSEIFKAGVDLHGVHDWHHWTLATNRDNLPLYPLDAPPTVLASALAASPISAVASWRSPVLLVHGDDDHNVAFSESVRLAEALREHGVDNQELVLPDEIHGFLRHASWLRVYSAAADFLDARLAPSPHS